FLGQHLAEQREVHRLVVDQHAVEVEDHRGDTHAPAHRPAHQIASGPRSPVRIRTQSTSGSTAIMPSPIMPSGPLRLAVRIAWIVGSTKSSFTAIWSSIFRSTLTVTSCPR